MKPFSWQRLGLLLRNELWWQRKSLLWLALIIFGTVMTFSSFAPFLYIIIGIVIPSMAFRSMHQPPQGYLTLLTPCTTFEYLLSKILLIALGYPLGFYLVGQLPLSLLGPIPWLSWAGTGHNTHPLDWTIVTVLSYHIYNYLPISGLLLAGSATFQSRPILKNLLTLLAVITLIDLLVISINSILLNFGVNTISYFMHYNDPNQSATTLTLISPLTVIGLSILGWVLTYWQIKRKTL